MHVTKLDTHSYRGENKQPSSGFAEFSDGRCYTWHRDINGSIFFGGWRRRNETTERFSFRSTRRSIAVEKKLN